ncbi:MULTISPECIES: hypothetical protein [unclassified Corynebacterium]|uniref:hypothetical protein n=1 Tax=unclassified Corynebacterium TaxID=2624378 RepID=UPI00309C8E5C
MRARTTGLGIVAVLALCISGCADTETAVLGDADISADSSSQNLPVTDDDKEILDNLPSSTSNSSGNSDRGNGINGNDPYLPPRAVVPVTPNTGSAGKTDPGTLLPPSSGNPQAPKPTRPVPVLPPSNSDTAPVDISTEDSQPSPGTSSNNQTSADSETTTSPTDSGTGGTGGTSTAEPTPAEETPTSEEPGAVAPIWNRIPDNPWKAPNQENVSPAPDTNDETSAPTEPTTPPETETTSPETPATGTTDGEISQPFPMSPKWPIWGK